MTTYAEKLKSPEWEKFRLEIIESNHWNCENCHNKKIKKKYYKGLFLGVSQYKYSTLAQEEKLLCFIIKFAKGKSAFNAFHWTKDESFLQKLNANHNCKVFYKSNQESNLETHYRIIAFKTSDEWFYVNDMHVHHTYYQEGLNPWEYPTKSLQTLCWDCHEKLHENAYIPHLDKNGIEIGKLNNCQRCYGAGYLPEYFYHKSGTCFECNGEGYNKINCNL